MPLPWKIMQNNWWEFPAWGTQCVMCINPEGSFKNAAEHVVCQVKKSSNKLLKHPSKNGENWKTLKSNSENIPFLRIPGWDRCCILWLHEVSWILILVQGNGKFIHFGGKERRGVGWYRHQETLPNNFCLPRRTFQTLPRSMIPSVTALVGLQKPTESSASLLPSTRRPSLHSVIRHTYHVWE